MKESLKKDVMEQVGSIYRMNAPHAIGYLFTVTTDGNKISHGMFAHSNDDINSEEWDYFFSFKKKIFRKLKGK